MVSINKQDLNYKLFSDWLDKVFSQNLPKEIKAFNFNLYESDNTYDIQLVGSDEFDEEGSDWACTDYFTSGENIFYIQKNNEIKSWKIGLKYIKELINNYLNNGKMASMLKDKDAIGIGFVDGDLEILYTKK